MLYIVPVAWQGSGCTTGHSAPRMVVAPSPESPSTGFAHNVYSGRSLTSSMYIFSGREALPPGRRTSRYHRRASHSAARPWTAWGCYGSGKHWTGMLPGSFSRSHAQGWSCLWHTCVVHGEAVSEPTGLQWNVSWVAVWWMHLPSCEPASLLSPQPPVTCFLSSPGWGGQRCFPVPHHHIPFGYQRPVDLVEILRGRSCPAVVENNFEPGEITNARLNKECPDCRFINDYSFSCLPVT